MVVNPPTPMVWILYNILFFFGFVLMLPKFLWRMKRRGGYRKDFLQRIGIFRPEVREVLRDGGRIWVHAVSVGELFVALKLMETLRERRPGARFVLSTTTSTGHAIGLEKIEDPDVLIYFPVDSPWVIHRVLNLVRPQALLLIEGEFWPNLIRQAHRRGIPKVLVNGRISERSFAGYRRLTIFTRRIFPLFDALCVQSDADRRRLVELGAPSEIVHVLSSAKYEVAERDAAREAKVSEVLERAGFGNGRLLLLGGSTWPGEERILLNEFKQLRREFPDLSLVLAPRHVERTPEVLTEIDEQGLSVIRRSAMPERAVPADAGADVFLIDTTGELTSFYSSATVIFIGKSLTSHGGQNLIEPAVCGKPIVVGPYMENFPVVIEDFKGAKAVWQVGGREELGPALRDLLSNESMRASYGESAAQLVREKAGAIAFTADRIERMLDEETE